MAYGERERNFQLYRRGRYVSSIWSGIAARCLACKLVGARVYPDVNAAAGTLGVRLSSRDGSPEAALSDFIKVRDWV